MVLLYRETGLDLERWMIPKEEEKHEKKKKKIYLIKALILFALGIINIFIMDLKIMNVIFRILPFFIGSIIAICCYFLRIDS